MTESIDIRSQSESFRKSIWVNGMRLNKRNAKNSTREIERLCHCRGITEWLCENWIRNRIPNRHRRKTIKWKALHAYVSNEHIHDWRHEYNLVRYRILRTTMFHYNWTMHEFWRVSFFAPVTNELNSIIRDKHSDTLLWPQSIIFVGDADLHSCRIIHAVTFEFLNSQRNATPE